MIFQTSRFQIDLSLPKIVGIVNLTPDSFSDGGRFPEASSALRYCERALVEGADILELGAESSRPGALPVPHNEELRRLLPVLREAVKLHVPIAVDTYKPAVMQVALELGCDIINDIWALGRSDSAGSAVDVVARHPSCGVVLMHMHGEPQTMQSTASLACDRGDVVRTVMDFLLQRSQVLSCAGIGRARIAWDTGIGFGKTVSENFALLATQAAFLSAGYPLVCAWSRKSSLGAVCNIENPKERVFAAVAAATLATERGARLLRVHDVKATRDAVRVWVAAQGGERFQN